MHRGVCERKYAIHMKLKIKNLIVIVICSLFLCSCGKEDAFVMELSKDDLADASLERVSENTTVIKETMDNMTEISEKIEEPQRIYVYVCGAVEVPGVYQLEEGSRLFEAVELAGGLTADADTTCFNLAKQLSDGEQVVILTQDETEMLKKEGKPIPGQEKIDTGQSMGSSSNLVNINTATVSELTTVSGIGESRAQAIIAYREKNGSFQSIDDIKKVDGIKDGLFSKIKDKITV